MIVFEVNNEIELGNAIWSSTIGDTIILKSGEYGNIPVKDGVNYEFRGNATAADILGLGVGGGGQWSASRVTFGNVSIKNPKIHNENIKLYYIFQKKMPFNSRLEHPISFVHANGVIINILGNNKEGFVLGGGDANAENQLPKMVVNVIVPVLEEFDVNKVNHNYLTSLFRGDFTEEEKAKEIEAHHNEAAKQKEIEKTDLYLSLGLQLNSIEYKALWSLNSFIREYSKIAEEEKIKGLNVSEFKDDLGKAIIKDLNEAASLTTQSFIGKFTGAKLDDEQTKNLSTSFLSSQEYSISDFIDYHLNNLNYSFATIGMYQQFESLWEAYSPDKRDKWGFIENFTSDPKTKAYLAEMINARNNIAHSRKLITFHENKNKLQTNWGAETLNEYEIYAKIRPWNWVKSLRVFKTAYNNHVN
jgi:ribosomal protein S18